MNCSEIHKHCHSYLDQQTDAAQSKDIDAHLLACSSCAKVVESQRTFLTVLKKLVVNCDATAAPAPLHARIRAGLDQAVLARAGSSVIMKPVEHAPAPAKATRAVPLRPIKMRGAMTMAASVMLGFAGLLGGQSLCITRQCPIVVAAEHEHANITAGLRGELARSEDLAQLTKAVSEKVDGASGFPSLCRCHLNPLRCGVVKVDGLPEGAYIQYAECTRQNDPVTLMIIDTDALSNSEILTIKEKQYHIARRDDHTVLSWHNEKNGKLYILVAHRTLDESIAIATVASND